MCGWGRARLRIRTAAGAFAVTVAVASRSLVGISGLAGGVETPEVGDDTATVTRAFTVSPADAVCTAVPAGAVVIGGPGAARSVSYDVPAGTSVEVRVTCRSGSHFATRAVRLAANDAPGAGVCDDPLGTLGQGAVSRPGRLGSGSGCRSLGRYGNRGSDSRYAGRHTFTMAAAGWVTIDLESTGAGGDRVDAYVVLINGSDPGGGTVLERDDDSGRGFDSRIVRRFLQPGRYTIEATTFGRGDAGTYRLTVAADYRPQIAGNGQPATLLVGTGATVTRTWSYEPLSARLSIVSVSPPNGLNVRIVVDEGTVTLIATASRADDYTVTIRYANGPTSFTQPTGVEAAVVDRSCPPTGDRGYRARQVHHHEPGRGHTSCQAHAPPLCTDRNPWNPGHEHERRDIPRCGDKNTSGGVVDPESLPWSPYDVDSVGNPVLCKEHDHASAGSTPAAKLKWCMEVHRLAVVTWSGGFDMDAWIADYTADTGRRVSAELRRDLEAVQRAVDTQGTILVGTSRYSRPTGRHPLDDAVIRLICGEVVEFGVERGVDAAAKRVGGWAQNRFPSGTVLKGAVKLSTILGFAQTVLGVLWQNFATDAACR